TTSCEVMPAGLSTITRPGSMRSTISVALGHPAADGGKTWPGCATQDVAGWRPTEFRRAEERARQATEQLRREPSLLTDGRRLRACRTGAGGSRADAWPRRPATGDRRTSRLPGCVDARRA